MAVKTKTQLRDYANANINSNGTQGITGAELNTLNIDEIDSFAMEQDAGKVKYSDDTDTATFLQYKLVAGSGIMLASLAPDPTHGDRVEIKASAVPVPMYKYDKRVNVAVSSIYPNWQEIGRLAVGTISDGIFEYKFSLTYTLDTTTRSAHFRFSTDGGTTWVEFENEPKDSHDASPFAYFFPKTLTAQNHKDIIVEMSKENAGDNLIVLFLDIIFHQVQ